MTIEPGAFIIATLHSPREKYWGLLERIDAAGVCLRGIDLNAFDDWVRSIIHDEIFIGPVDLFFPMWRIERLNRDEVSSGVASFSEQFVSRTGRALGEIF